jgi:lipoprotein-releasing system ATP-binding protein
LLICVINKFIKDKFVNIAVENIKKSFYIDHGVEVKALRNVSLEVKAGETIAIMGPSGAGKSTLLHILGLMDRPTDGKLLIDGKDYLSLDENIYSETRQNKIGFLFQMHYLLPDFTVLENVMIPVWKEREEGKRKAVDILSRLGLANRHDHMPSELSGGEQQRVAMARALVKSPEILMADEPTGNLDRETGEKVEEVLFTECRKSNISLVLVTHNPDLAAKAGKIIRVRDGLLE